MPSRVACFKPASIAAISAAILSLAGCREGVMRAAANVTGGDPYRGVAAIRRFGCGACHTIPGVSGAHGMVGPNLTGFASRLYIGGVLQNTPEHSVRWIQDPKAIDEKTAMPKLGIGAADATDIAAYLYTLR